MEEFGYDQDVMLGHKQKHKDFVSKVVDFRNKFQSMQELDLGQVRAKPCCLVSPTPCLMIPSDTHYCDISHTHR